MSCPPYSAGARMHTSDAPPTRKSISALGDVNPFGPHHRVTYSGSLQAIHASPTGASRTRVTTTSYVPALSFWLSLFMAADPFQSSKFVPPHEPGGPPLDAKTAGGWRGGRPPRGVARGETPGGGFRTAG